MEKRKRRSGLGFISSILNVPVRRMSAWGGGVAKSTSILSEDEALHCLYNLYEWWTKMITSWHVPYPPCKVKLACHSSTKKTLPQL